MLSRLWAPSGPGGAGAGCQLRGWEGCGRGPSDSWSREGWTAPWPSGGFRVVVRAVKLGVGLSGMGEDLGGTQVDKAGGRGRAPVWGERGAGLTLAASDSCTSSSTESARQDRLSMEPRRRRPAHRVAIAASPSSPHSRSPRDLLSVGLRLGLRLFRPHFRLGPCVTGRAGPATKTIRPGNGSRCEGREAARCPRSKGGLSGAQRGSGGALR